MFKQMIDKLGAEFGFVKEELGAMKPVELKGIEQDINNRLDKSMKLDEVDTITFGLETDDGKIVKVYVKTDDAEAFEKALSTKLGEVDDIEQVLNDLSKDYEIVDVEWPDKEDDKKKDQPDEAEETGKDSLDPKVYNKKQERNEHNAKNEGMSFGELATLTILDESQNSASIEHRFTTSYQLMVYHAIIELGIPAIALARSPYRALIIKGIKDKALHLQKNASEKSALKIFINRAVDYDAKAESHKKHTDNKEDGDHVHRHEKQSKGHVKEETNMKISDLSASVKAAVGIVSEEKTEWNFDKTDDGIKISCGEISFTLDEEQCEKLIKGITNKEATIVKDADEPTNKFIFSPRGSQALVKRVGATQSYMMSVGQIDKMLDELGSTGEDKKDDAKSDEKDDDTHDEEGKDVKGKDAGEIDKKDVKEAMLHRRGGGSYTHPDIEAHYPKVSVGGYSKLSKKHIPGIESEARELANSKMTDAKLDANTKAAEKKMFTDDSEAAQLKHIIHTTAQKYRKAQP